MQVKKQQLELDMEQQIGSKSGKEYIKTSIYCLYRLLYNGILSPCLFNLYAEYIMRNVGVDEWQAGIMIAGRNIKTTDMQMTPLLWQKVKN